MKFKSIFKNPVKATKDSFKDIRNPGKHIKSQYETVKHDITNPKEALSDRWENIKDNPFPSVRPQFAGPYAEKRPGAKPGVDGAAVGNALGGTAQGPHPDTGYYMPPRNTRISPGVYADGRGGVIMSRNRPGPVDTQAVFNQIVANSQPGQQQYAPGDGFTPGPINMERPFPSDPSQIDPGFVTAPPQRPDLSGGVPYPQLPPNMGKPLITGPRPTPKPGGQMNGPFGPGVYENAAQAGRYAPGAMPQDTRGDVYAPRQPAAPAFPVQQIPPRGTRLSPGIYADGRGGAIRR